MLIVISSINASYFHCCSILEGLVAWISDLIVHSCYYPLPLLSIFGVDPVLSVKFGGSEIPADTILLLDRNLAPANF
jgi:hypothetical protein